MVRGARTAPARGGKKKGRAPSPKGRGGKKKGRTPSPKRKGRKDRRRGRVSDYSDSDYSSRSSRSSRVSARKRQLRDTANVSVAAVVVHSRTWEWYIVTVGRCATETSVGMFARRIR